MTKKEADNLGFFPQNFASAVDLLSVGNKVNGWINEFFDYIFIQEINSCNDPIAKKEKFAKLFPELNTILQILCNMI